MIHTYIITYTDQGVYILVMHLYRNMTKNTH